MTGSPAFERDGIENGPHSPRAARTSLPEGAGDTRGGLTALTPVDAPGAARPEEVQSEEFWQWFDGRKPRTRRARAHGQRERAERRTRAIGYALTGSGRRKRPTADQRTEILNRQRNRCLYCENEFGAEVRRNNVRVALRLHWDHFVPYAYGQTNAGANWVAACHVCNGIKSARTFDTIAEAQIYIRARWAEKGYELHRFPAAAPKPVEKPKPINSDLVPLELAQVADDVSRSLEENSFAIALSGIHIPGRSPDMVKAAVFALFESGYRLRTSAVGATRYSSIYPYRAPQGAPEPVAKAPKRHKPLHPAEVECPRCGERPPGRCVTPRGTTKTGFHPERVNLAKESS